MSDRVSYMVGNTIHRDHIQWPTILRSEIPTVLPSVAPSQYDQIWPVDITLDQIMALSWRVRKWKLSGSCSAGLTYVVIIGFPPAPLTVISSATATISNTDIFALAPSGIAAALTEKDLVGKVFANNTTPYKALTNAGIGPLPDGAPVSNWSIAETRNGIPHSESGDTEVTLDFMDGFHLFDSGLFSPPFGVIGEMVGADGSGGTFGFSLHVAFLRNPITVSSGTGPLELLAPATLTIKSLIAPDLDVPLQLAFRLPFEAPGSTLSAGSGDGEFTLEATEFWPFDGTWDTATGAQLLDPFR